MGQRPTAMLFHDHFYGYRDPETGDPELAAGDVYWSEWDYALADAMQFIQDHTDQHGHLIWEVESDRTTVKITKKIDRHNAQVERATSGKKYKPTPGEYFVSRVELAPGWEEDGFPTFSEWFEEQNKLLGIAPENP